MPDAVQIGPFLLDDPPLLGQRLADLDTRIEAIQAVEYRSGIGYQAAGIHDRGHRQPVPQTDLEVVGVMGRE